MVLVINSATPIWEHGLALPLSSNNVDTMPQFLHLKNRIIPIRFQQFYPICNFYFYFQSGLEKKLDEAVDKKDFDTAEDISNQLATRDLGCKIAKAADARDYLAQKHVSTSVWRSMKNCKITSNVLNLKEDKFGNIIYGQYRHDLQADIFI